MDEDEDDLPPRPRRDQDAGFAGALGWTVGRFVWVAFFLVIVGAGLYAATHWL
jgi:hypothetical protein